MVLRVLFVSHSSQLLGAERSLLTTLKHVDRRRCHPIALLPGPGPLEDALLDLGVEVHKRHLMWWLARRNSWPVFLARTLQLLVHQPRLKRLLRRLGVDLVYTNSLVVPAGAWAAKAVGIPHVWHIRELPENNATLQSPLPLRWIYRCVSWLSTEVVCNSPAVAEHLLKYGVFASQIPNPIAMPPECVPAVLPGDSPHLLVVGTISPAKGQHVVVRALPKLAASQASLHFVGTGPAPYRSSLEALVADLGVGSRVFFHGEQGEPAPYFLAADLVVVPSLEEAFGRTAVEALLCGRQVIGTDAGGLTEILPPENRFAVDDSSSLAKVADAALAEPPPGQSDLVELLRARHDPARVAGCVADLVERVGGLEHPD